MTEIVDTRFPCPAALICQRIVADRKDANIVGTSLVLSDVTMTVTKQGKIEFSLQLSTQQILQYCDPTEMYDSMLHDRCIPPRMVYDPHNQRGQKQTQGRTSSWIPKTDAAQLNSMKSDILTGQQDFLELMLNLPIGDWYYINNTNELVIHSGPLTRPDSNHRITAIVMAERIFRKTGADFHPEYDPDRRYRCVIMTLDAADEGLLFAKLNRKGKKVAPEVAIAIGMRNGGGSTATKIAAQLLNANPNLRAVTAMGGGGDSAASWSLTTLVEAIAEAKFENTPEHVAFLNAFMIEWQRRVPIAFAVARPKDKKILKGMTVSMSSPVVCAVFQTAKMFLDDHSDWHWMMSRMDDKFFDRKNPVWKNCGLVTPNNHVTGSRSMRAVVYDEIIKYVARSPLSLVS